MSIATNLDREAILRELQLPLAIFRTRRLAPLEAASKYLREEYRLTYREIAVLLKRNPDIIGITYRKARKKQAEPFVQVEGKTVSIVNLALEKCSLLEAITHKLAQEDTLQTIAVLLNRNPRTVWTLNHRAEVKLNA